jgi:hypothetical protein
VAWSELSVPGVKILDIASGEQQTVFPDDEQVQCFSLQGDRMVAYIVDFAFFFPWGRVVAKDLVTAEETLIAAPGASLFSGAFGCPDVDGNLVAYTKWLEETSAFYPCRRSIEPPLAASSGRTGAIR